LLKNGVPEARALKLSKAQRFAWAVIARELDGRDRFNWATRTWERLPGV
jgi:hypothetical protein